MASTSGGADQKPNGSNAKMKVNFQKKDKSSEWSVASNRRARNSSKNSESVPVSPNLQFIIDSQPQLPLSGTQFEFNAQNKDYNSNINRSTAIANDTSVVGNSSTDMDLDTNINNDSNYYNKETVKVITMPSGEKEDVNLKRFSNSFSGPVYVIIQSMDNSLNLGKLHPMKIGKILYKAVCGIAEIKSIGERVRVTFDSTINANACLESKLLAPLGLKALIPASLIYSFGVIRLDTTISESEFFEGLECKYPVISFRRISSRVEDNSLVPSRLVELKFLSSKLPDRITVFKVFLPVSPSVRSSVQCSNCVRFGHTSKFCRSKSRCSHCGELGHKYESCSSVNATEPQCIFCKGDHPSTNRNCPEWTKQKDIKKVMAVENISYSDAIRKINNNFVSKAFSYAHVSAKPPYYQSPSVSNPLSYDPSSLPNSNLFPTLPPAPAVNNNSFVYKRKKNNNTRSWQKSNISNFPGLADASNTFVSPNGAFLSYVESNKNVAINNPTSNSLSSLPLSEVSSALSNHLSAAMTDNNWSKSAASLSQIIESLLTNILSASPAELN